MTSPLCEGDACAAISVAWDREAGCYRVYNRSDRSIRVYFQTWPSVTEMLLEPRARASLNVMEFEHPYRAMYCNDN